jgi:hypothetical protein
VWRRLRFAEAEVEARKAADDFQSAIDGGGINKRDRNRLKKQVPTQKGEKFEPYDGWLCS